VELGHIKHEAENDMSRILTLAYGVVIYLIFFGTYLYAIGFLGNVVVPKSLDSGPIDPLPTALAIDLALLSLFAIQHSVMARPGFKRLLTRVIPVSVERSTYVLVSSLLLILLFWQWRPLGGMVWEVQHPVGRALLYGGFAFGWLLVLVSTFVINHFDLFGLRQTWRAFRGQPQAAPAFVTPVLYRIVRHPLYVGWLFAFWSTPTMTVSHLLFAVMTTAYILVAIQLEERDLMTAHPEYAEYRRRVPMLVPRMRRQVTAPQPVRAGRA
jgi:protein-S-isoprenylcysteine O-methyltransferase Ste14